MYKRQPVDPVVLDNEPSTPDDNSQGVKESLEYKVFPWDKVVKEDLPSKAVLHSDSSVKLTKTGEVIKIEGGTVIEPVSVNSSMLTARVSSLQGAYVKIPVSATNVQRITESNYRKRVGLPLVKKFVNKPPTQKNPKPKPSQDEKTPPHKIATNNGEKMTSFLSEMDIRNLVRKSAPQLKALSKATSAKAINAPNQTVDGVTCLLYTSDAADD